MDAENVETSAGERAEYTAKSRLIHKGPLKFCCAMLAADGANSDCQVYDGESANDDLKAHVEAISGTTFGWAPPGGVKFHKGLYVALSANAKVTVTFTPVSRKA